MKTGIYPVKLLLCELSLEVFLHHMLKHLFFYVQKLPSEYDLKYVLFQFVHQYRAYYSRNFECILPMAYIVLLG